MELTCTEDGRHGHGGPADADVGAVVVDRLDLSRAFERHLTGRAEVGAAQLEVQLQRGVPETRRLQLIRIPRLRAVIRLRQMET